MTRKNLATTNDALALALSALRRRDYLEHELREYLVSRETDREGTEAVISSLRSWGFLDDERVSLGVVRKRLGQGYGHLRVLEELRSKGAPEDVVGAVATSFEDERAIAEKALVKKFPKGGEPARMARFLAGRGFSEETIEGLLGELGA